MKKAFYVLLLLCSYTLSAQTPQFIHYQAVIRDGNGAVLSNQTIGLKLEITQGQDTYTEVRTVTTNNLGLVNLNVGSLPAPNSIPFSSINWADGNASLLTWYDPTNTNTNWQYIGSSSIASVPYALHAANVFSGDFNDLTNVPNIDTSATNELQTISSQGDTIHLSGGGFIYFERFSGDFADLNGVPNLDTSSTNELQSIAQNGDTISMSKGGGSVVISTFSGEFGDLTNVPPIDTSNVNELQVLSMSGDTLYLSNGGYVVLPISAKAERIDDLLDARTTVNSLALGEHALQSATTGLNNTSVGQYSSKENITGNANTSVGYMALSENTIGSDNTAIGTFSMRDADSSNWNTAVGYASLERVKGWSNTAVGHLAMNLNTSGHQNTAVGKDALYNNTTGFSNVAFGYKSLVNNTSGIQNTALGRITLEYNKQSVNNTAVGEGALHTLEIDSVISNNNTALGNAAFYRLRSGSSNVAIGSTTGAWLTGGSQNILIGSANSVSQSIQREINQNVLIGNNAASIIANGSDNNTVLGNAALGSLTEGDNNIALGSNVANLIAKGDNNIFIGGVSAGVPRLLPVFSNVAIGGGSGARLDSNAYANVFMGENAGNMMRGGSDNVAIGHAALQSSPKGGYNVAVGTQAMQMSDVETSSNTAIGAQSLSNVKSNDNTAVGKGAMNQTTLGSSNTGVGVNSLNSNYLGNSNTAIGFYSLYTLGADSSQSYDNIGIGEAALALLEDGSQNIGIGGGTYVESGSKNVFIGGGDDIPTSGTGSPSNAPTNVTNNTMVGFGAGDKIGNNASLNTAIGEHSIYYVGSSKENTAVGAYSLNKAYLGNQNVAIGYNSMGGSAMLTNNYGNTGNVAKNNVAIGSYSNFANNGSDNVTIGHRAGESNWWGHKNTLIGAFSSVDSSAVYGGINNATAIGFEANVTESNAIQLGNEDVNKVATHGRIYSQGGTISDSSTQGDQAVLRLSSNTKGFVYPRMTLLERNSISGEIGMTIYCTNCGLNGQLQVFNGLVWTDFCGNQASGVPTVNLGDTAFGGVVAYIFQPGDLGYVSNEQHGIIVAFEDLPSKYTWGSGGNLQGLISNSSSIGSAYMNTDTILVIKNLLLQSGIPTNFPAIYAASNYTGSGYVDWVLPSSGDLNAIKSNLQVSGISNFQTTAVNGNLSTGYWSSSVMSNWAGAVAPMFAPGAGNCGCAYFESYYVRPVRYF